MLLKLKLELSGCRKYTRYQKLVAFLMLLRRFITVLLLCKCKLSFKFVVIPKIKVSTLLQNRKVRSHMQVSCTERKNFHRNYDQSKKPCPPIKVTPLHGIQSPVKHLRWNFLPKLLTDEICVKNLRWSFL